MDDPQDALILEENIHEEDVSTKGIEKDFNAHRSQEQEVIMRSQMEQIYGYRTNI